MAHNTDICATSAVQYKLHERLKARDPHLGGVPKVQGMVNHTFSVLLRGAEFVFLSKVVLLKVLLFVYGPWIPFANYFRHM